MPNSAKFATRMDFYGLTYTVIRVKGFLANLGKIQGRSILIPYLYRIDTKCIYTVVIHLFLLLYVFIIYWTKFR